MSLLEDLLVTFLESHFLFFWILQIVGAYVTAPLLFFCILDIVGAYVSVPFIFLYFGQSGCICECIFNFQELRFARSAQKTLASLALPTKASLRSLCPEDARFARSALKSFASLALL